MTLNIWILFFWSGRNFVRRVRKLTSPARLFVLCWERRRVSSNRKLDLPSISSYIRRKKKKFFFFLLLCLVDFLHFYFSMDNIGCKCTSYKKRIGTHQVYSVILHTCKKWLKEIYVFYKLFFFASSLSKSWIFVRNQLFVAFIPLQKKLVFLSYHFLSSSYCTHT